MNAQNTALEKKTGVTAIAAIAEKPAWLKENDTRGTENIGIQNMRPPALKLAQSGSKEVKRSEVAHYIQGLTEGLFFDSITKEIYGEGPLSFVVVKELGTRNIEFVPMDEGGGVKDFDVPDNDPRCQWRNEVRDGEKVRLKPIATRFYDYMIILLLPDGRHQTMTWSLKGTQLKKAEIFNTLLVGGRCATFAKVWTVTAVPESKKAFNWMGVRIDPGGWLGDQAIYDEAEKLFTMLEKGEAKVEVTDTDQDEPNDGDAPF